MGQREKSKAAEVSPAVFIKKLNLNGLIAPMKEIVRLKEKPRPNYTLPTRNSFSEKEIVLSSYH